MAIDFGPGIGEVSEPATAFGMLVLLVGMPPSPMRELYMAITGDTHRRHAVDEFGSYIARNLASAYSPLTDREVG